MAALWGPVTACLKAGETVGVRVAVKVASKALEW